MTTQNKNIIAIVGVGNMGAAILRGLLANQWQPDNIELLAKSDQQAAKLKKDFPGCTVINTSDSFSAQASTFILAVKPHDLHAACLQLKNIGLADDTLFISAAAGVPVSAMSAWLDKTNIIRCMPNTPAAIGLGMTGIYAPEHVDEEQITRAEKILQCTGTTLRVNSENMLDAVTAISGSGPAYLFYFMECLQQGGEKLGLSAEQSKQLTIEMIRGASLLAHQSEHSFEQLRIAVTSKGGTTEQALNQLAAADFKDIIERAVAAASERANQISQSYTEQ